MKIHYKKLIYTLLILVTLVTSFTFLKFKLLDNTINVTGDNNVNLQKVVIKSISDKVLYKNEEMVSKLNEDHFLVFYDGELIGQAGIDRWVDWHTHNYYFNILKKGPEIVFEFNAKGLDEKSLYYKRYKMDNINNKSTEIFYNSDGPDGQINIHYYDHKGKVITDECWVNDTLIHMNLYSDGNWYKNYSTHKYYNDTKYSLIKIDSDDSLIYVYRISKDNKTMDERIAIQK